MKIIIITITVELHSYLRLGRTLLFTVYPLLKLLNIRLFVKGGSDFPLGIDELVALFCAQIWI